MLPVEADTAALALAGFAVFLGASVAAVLVFRPLSRRAIPEPEPNTEPEPDTTAESESRPSETTPTPPTRAVAEPDPDQQPTSSISVAITADEDGRYRWRVTVPANGDRTTVDVFSFRSASGNTESAWQHELLAAPLRVTPGHGASVGAPIDPAVDYTVSIGWTSHRATGDRHSSELLHVPAR